MRKLPINAVCLWGALLLFVMGPHAIVLGRIAEQVIPLSIVEGDPTDPGRVFAVPIECNGVKTEFGLGCSGTTRISEGLAEQIHASVVPPDRDLKRHRAPDGKPIFAGTAVISIRFGGLEGAVPVSVMKDEYCQKSERQGLLGYDVMKAFQFEVDPTAPSLTLRPLGTPPASKPLAILPLLRSTAAAYVKVRIRNVTADVQLMPASSYVQAGPMLQREWDLGSGKKIEPHDMEINRFGNIRVLRLYGDDVVELGNKLRETDLPVALLGDAKNPSATTMESSGIGQCLLNRFVWCVDPRRGQLRLMSRVQAPPPKPAVVTTRPSAPVPASYKPDE
ncbi:MAG TPA: hypothetical protein VN541_24260 [Tepidisphaeraceae bacterium]|nr:hypothetical protein [Tepidisphaeraceae bacterium]